MHLAFYGAVHPAGFAAARQHDAKTEQQSANDRIRASPHNFRCNAQLHVAENTNGADRHAENNRFRHMGASGDPQVAKGRSKADLRALDQQPKPDAEQHRQPQFRLMHCR